MNSICVLEIYTKMNTKIEIDAPDSFELKESTETVLTEQEAYAMAQEINENDPNHQASVQEGKLKVQQVLRG